MYARSLEPVVRDALRRSPVVLVNGARQVGKSTLARALVAEDVISRYVTLDDLSTLDAALSDPEGFVAAFKTPVVIDEVQLAPPLFRAIKAEVDRDRRPGRFLLTGSADLSVLPSAADALVGRMEVLTLWPLTQGEILGRSEGFIDALFSAQHDWAVTEGVDRSLLASAICRGGFPEPVTRALEDREPWFRSYVDLVVRRDLSERVDVGGMASVPRLLALLAARTTTLVSLAEVARSLEMPASTVRRYVALLEAAMLVRTIPAFAGDVARRMVKSPKVALVDTGLAAAITGLDEARLLDDPTQFGRLAETFVLNEVERQAGWSVTKVRMMHMRTAAGREVDIVLETWDGRIAGIEVKVGATVGARDFAGLRSLRESVGERFVQGVVVHSGERATPFGPDLWALPASALWETPPSRVTM